jgi:hypothetical protein
MKTKESIVLIVLFLSIVSCTSKIVFNNTIRSGLEGKSIKPEKLQFYIDRSMELRREVSSNETKITSGRVELYKGKTIQIIEIKKHTPGVCLRSTDSTIDVAFENGSDAYFQFIEREVRGFENKIYVLNKYRDFEGINHVMYAGQAYKIDEFASDARILIKRKIANSENVKTKTIKGRKIK